jgi:uncharacterized membrane protein
MNYSTAAALGVITGLRSFSGPAVVANRLGTPGEAHFADALAVSELIADKLPFMPDRTKPGALAFRAVSGAVCGYLMAKNKKRTQGEKLMSAFVAGAAAVAAAYAGLEFRKRVKLPPLTAALLEDAFTVGSGAAVAALIGQ